MLKCPKCGAPNPDNMTACYNCKNPRTAQTVQQAPQPPPVQQAQANPVQAPGVALPHSIGAACRYPFLRFISIAIKVVACLGLVLGVLLPVIFFMAFRGPAETSDTSSTANPQYSGQVNGNVPAETSDTSGRTTGLLLYGLGLVTGSALMFMTGEMVRLAIDVEENTRIAARRP